MSQRQVGTDTKSFETALRAAVREDPDVVMVGEMRDLESISFALTIAETGHLVLATMHTNDSVQTIDRIIDVFPADRRPQIQLQLSGTLLAVIYQRLMPRATSGLVAAYEVMIGVPAVRNLIREGKTRQLRNVMSTHRADGMQTLEVALAALIQDGTIDYPTAEDASLYPEDLPRSGPQTVAFADAREGSRLMLGGGPRARPSGLPYQILAGVEPCPGGWLVAPGNLQGITVAPQPAYVLTSLADVLDYRPSFSVVALHAPVGLVEAPDERRLCDTTARDLLGVRAGAAVPAPSRQLLEVRTFAEAKEIDPSLDIVRWRSLPKATEAIREVQSWRQRAVWEVNPELAFRQMNDGDVLRYSRRSIHGRRERQQSARGKAAGDRAGAAGTPERGQRGEAARCPRRPVDGPAHPRPGHHPPG